MKKANVTQIYNSKTPKTYKNKKLNNANFGNFTHNDYQVFLHLVSKLGGVDEFGKYLQPEQLEREHILSAKEFNSCVYRPLFRSTPPMLGLSEMHWCFWVFLCFRVFVFWSTLPCI